MSVTWNILCILPCPISLSFAALLKNQVECIFLALLSCWHLYASRWFLWDILSLRKSLPENFKFKSSLGLVPRFLRFYMTDCFFLRQLNFIITPSDLFVLWQTCRYSGVTLTLVSDNALQTLGSKTSSCISASTRFTSIVSILLYWKFIAPVE